MGLYISTTALSGTERIRDGTVVNSILTSSHGQYSWGSQPGGPPAPWNSSQMNPYMGWAFPVSVGRLCRYQPMASG